MAHLADHLGQLKLSGLEVPLLAIPQSVEREVAGTNVSRVEA